MAGLAPATLRQEPPEVERLVTEGVTVEIVGDDGEPKLSDDGLTIEYADGSIDVSLNGRGLGQETTTNPEGWFSNLADKIEQTELGRIANDLLRGISDDDMSRQEWIEARKTGIQLLGLKVEIPGLQGASDGAPVEGMSKVRHPLLLEAVLRFQANARSELLPTDGPVKIRNDDNQTDLSEDMVASALERDLNHYLTSTATEYYPDTDRMLLMLGFGGTAFKKVYFCPLRNRPVSETVDAEDLIVTANATDLANARRVTHKIAMPPSTVKRMQILGAYRDIELSTPNAPPMNDAEREKASQVGISVDVTNPDDRNRLIYECYTDLDIAGFEHKLKGEPTGLELPYRVTLDLTSQQVLSIVRNFNRPAKDELPEKRTTFIQYVFIPGLGAAPFYGIGLLHILGNTTNALTAAWREMLDNGMFANFPGFLISKGAARQQTNIIRVPPGGGAQVDVLTDDIRKGIMPLPYETAHMPALQNLATQMAETGMRVGGTSEQQVGEGRADAPVGTTLAMIDQATKILNSVHKRMHTAQAEEFSLLVECFREHPDSFWQRKGKSGYPWDEQTFLQAIHDYDLVPQADPNTASHTQRVMKVMGLKQLQGANPTLYDAQAIDTAALQTLGWSNPQQFFAKPDTQANSPEVIKGIAEIQDNAKKADAALISANANMVRAQKDGQAGLGAAQPTPADLLKAKGEQEKLGFERERLAFDREELEATTFNEEADREADHHLEVLRIAREVMKDDGKDPGNKAEKIDKSASDGR